MNIVLSLLVVISLPCIFIFVLFAMVKLFRRKPAKKNFKLAGLSALIFLFSFIGLGFTPVETDLDNTVSNTRSANIATTTPTPEPTVAPIPEPTAAPTLEPTAAPTPEPTAAPTPDPTTVPTPKPTPVPVPDPAPVPVPDPAPVPVPDPAPVPVPDPPQSGILVWVDDTAKRYHRKNGCGMDNAYQVTLEEAIAMGKTPCGRCYK